MGKLYCLMGKSASGKDSIYKELLKQQDFPLRCVLPYTTRPRREGEQDGVDYYFCDEQKVKELEAAGKIIELRCYQTVHGPWKYFTVDDGQLDFTTNDYLIIVTLEAYEHIVSYFGQAQVVPIYVEVEDGERLERALTRERQQSQPKYAEMCRRFLADCEDFSEINLEKAKVTRRFVNEDMTQTIGEIITYMKQQANER